MTAFNVFTTVGTGLGLILGAVQIWRLLRPAERLHCKAIHVPYHRDPVVHQFYEYSVNSDSRTGNKGIGTYWATNARNTDNQLVSYWILSITNTGSKTLTNVRLRVEDGAAAAQIQNDGTFTNVGPDNPIVLGQLFAKDIAKVHLWTTIPPTVERTLTLVHDAGEATVRIYRPTHPFLQWLRSTLPGIIVLIVLLVVIAIVSNVLHLVSWSRLL